MTDQVEQQQEQQEEQTVDVGTTEEFEFAQWRILVKRNPETMRKLVQRWEQSRMGRQLDEGRRMLAAFDNGQGS